MLLSVEGNPQPEQVQKLEAWWKRFVSGVKNAWQSVVISEALNPVVIGDGLADLDTEKIIEPRRQDVATALGVPYTLLSPASANYATAREERLTFIKSTIVPECILIQDILNAQVLNTVGLRMEFDPLLLEEMQQSEFEKTMSLVPLYDAGILTKNEIRAALGYEPVEDELDDLHGAVKALRAALEEGTYDDDTRCDTRSDGNTLSLASESLDRGLWLLSTGTDKDVYLHDAYTYDLYGAAVECCRLMIAKIRDEYTFSTDEGSFNRSDRIEHLEKLIAQYQATTRPYALRIAE